MAYIRVLLLVGLSLTGIVLKVNGQSKNNTYMESKQVNPLLCDPASGICELPSTNSEAAEPAKAVPSQEMVKVIYFTDPICSSCWGIEPQLRKLKLEYGGQIVIEYRMGGLLPDWNYNSGGISKPSDVAHHWDEVSSYYDMPIDGDLWLEDPLSSSYPPSIAFKAAQQQDAEKAIRFLREIREMVFLKKMNITRWEHLEAAASNVGLDAKRFKSDYDGQAKALFEEDLQLARTYRVRGFPTMFFENQAGATQMVYGSRPYADYEAALQALNSKLQKQAYDTSWEALFDIYHTLTAREFAELSGMDRREAEALLEQLSKQSILKQLSTKNGCIWQR
ncbi:DsbA family protein [Carboxylicivirga taeanensis]|uniref:DsbA family protein n=1 Tax=Carboxylicivirga taeanensis TaxID=1416875 RepID=UPI003F6DC1B3